MSRIVFPGMLAKLLFIKTSSFVYNSRIRADRLPFEAGASDGAFR